MRLGVIPCLCLIILLSALPVQAQVSDQKEASPPVQRSEVEALKHELEETKAELRALREEMKQLKNGATPGPQSSLKSSGTTAVPTPLPTAAGSERVLAQKPEPSVPLPGAQLTQEREIELGELPGGKTPQEILGLPRLEAFGTRINGFAVGSFNYNSHLQVIPEFAGGVPAQADPDRTNFRFDRFTIALAKAFAPWLLASASLEVTNHRSRHSHLVSATDTSRFGCPIGEACERFGAEEAETEIELDKLSLTAIAPLGNGVGFSLGRFDVPFGIEREDQPFLLQATTSEVFNFGRPQKVTGFQVAYPVSPALDINLFVVNRWESETTEDSFNDNNRDKTYGGRIGFTPFPREGLLNLGIGGFYGPEQEENNSNKRWVVDFDFTWTPLSRLLFAGELVYGRETGVEFRERGEPIPGPEGVKSVNWVGSHVTAHYDFLDWLAFTFRYGIFDDMDGGRTGVTQVLQSFTFAPIIHLSALASELRPLGVTVPRTRHPLHWVDLKVEYRLNHSNEPVFGSVQPGTAVSADDAHQTSHQVQLQLVVNY